MAMDDKNESAEAQVASEVIANVNPAAKQENPNVATLKSAFPDIDSTVINAVLIASSNNLEKAFDGLLGMSDPSFKPDMPARPVERALSYEQQYQISADEEYARKLASQNTRRQRPSTERRQSQQESTPQDSSRNFLDDDLPVLKENIVQGFNETKLKVGSFISNLRTQYNLKMQANSGGDDAPPESYHHNRRTSTQYDRDAHTLDDDFGELQLQDNTGIDQSTHSGQPSKARFPESATKATRNPVGKASEPSPASRPDSFALGDDED